MKVTQKEAVRILDSLQHDGTIFTVGFIKRSTGEYRELNGRGGVHKGVQGVGLPFDPNSKGLLVFYDIQKQAFRMVPQEGIRVIRAHRKEYEVK